MIVNKDHWLRGVRRAESSSFNARLEPHDPYLIVVHGISLPPGEFGGRHCERLFTGCLDPAAHPSFASLEGLEVSPHLFVDRSGALLQCVPFDRRAWHAGVSSRRGIEDVNGVSIGIELEGTDETPYEPAQYARLIDVIASLIDHYASLSLDALAGHRDVAPGRKTDPGTGFDWPSVIRGVARRRGSGRE